MAVNADRDRARALAVAGDFGPEALTLIGRPAAALPDAVEVAVTRPGLASHHPGREAGIATTAARAAPRRHRESARMSGSRPSATSGMPRRPKAAGNPVEPLWFRLDRVMRGRGPGRTFLDRSPEAAIISPVPGERYRGGDRRRAVSENESAFC